VKLERRLQDLIVFSEDSLIDALNKMSRNRRRIVFCVSSSGVLEGVLTDGDLRRWLVTQDPIDLERPALEAANRTFISAKSTAPFAEVAALFDARAHQVPLLDERGRLVAVADRDASPFVIGDHTIDANSPVFCIAEIGMNHNGDVEQGHRLIEAAAASGADCAKFQMRDLASLYRNEGDEDDVSEDLGSQYVLDLVRRFELPTEQMYALFDHCVEIGITPLCTAWDADTVERLQRYGIAGFKVASADLTNHDLLRTVAATGKPLLLSTGMSTDAEISESINVLQALGASYALLHCNSTYPAPFRDLNLRYLERLRELGSCPIGYSGHERGDAAVLAAVALGAQIVEKHFTIDRSLEGNDHKVSMLPGEFASMVDKIRDVEAALGSPQERKITQGELINRVALAKSVVASRPIAAGQTIQAVDLVVKGPGRGLQPNRRDELIGRTSRRDVAAGDFFYPSDLDDPAAVARPFTFRRPWGIPVRYHDVQKMLSISAPDFVEFHLSYKDLDVDPARFLDAPLDIGLAVHSPELFAGDHLLDLAHDDPSYRAQSIELLGRVCDLTRRLKAWFPTTERPVIITNMGGFSHDRPLVASTRSARYERVADALAQVDASGVEIIAQTMPPYPWLMGGQSHHNLFKDPEDTVAFCRDHGLRLCLDTSHSKLAANEQRASFRDWTEVFAPHTAHLHIVDATGVDGEGIGIGAGEIDFPVLAEQLDRLCPDAWFIPEIWQGHTNDGEGFWAALDELERWL